LPFGRVFRQVGLPFYGEKHQRGDDGVNCRDVYDDPFRSCECWQWSFLLLMP
jgi:hypothetical protein